jgi:hypothetical protein
MYSIRQLVRKMRTRRPCDREERKDIRHAPICCANVVRLLLLLLPWRSDDDVAFAQQKEKKDYATVVRVH